MKRVISLLSVTSLLAVAALAPGCQDGAGATPPAPTEPDAGAAPNPGTPGPDAAPAAIPLATWVHLLVTDDPEGLREPDTVHDKNIEDTSNPEAFVEFLPTP